MSKKAVVLPIKPKYIDMIRSGDKIFEFRGYPLDIGMKGYFYETLGKKHTCSYCNGSGIHVEIEAQQINDNGDYIPVEVPCQCEPCRASGYYYEGVGAIVGEFVVDEVFSIDYWQDYPEPSELNFISLTDEKNDFTITEFYVDSWEEIVSQGIFEALDKNIKPYNNTIQEKLFEERRIKNKNKSGFILDLGTTQFNKNIGYAIKMKDIKFYDTPIPKEEFVLWNSWKKLYDNSMKSKDNQKKFKKHNLKFEDLDFTYLTQEQFEQLNNVKHAPQSRVYVVEKKL